MSTSELTGLRDYLYRTLSPDNMLWLASELTNYAKRDESNCLRPYTMKEIDAMLNEAETAFEAGEYLKNDEVFKCDKTKTA